MAQNNKTLYDVLGVSRNAKVTDIGLAYNRFKAEAKKESAIPDPRRAAMAKVAFETLSDPERRAEYDASLVGSAQRGGRGKLIAISLVLVVAAAGTGYWYLYARPTGQTAEKPLAAQEFLEAVSPHVGRLQSALISGEVRELGTAVAIGENEMVTTCRGFTAGAQLSVKMAGFTSKAELGRANEDLDICTLGVKDARAGIQMRQSVPAAREKIEAVVLGATGLPQVRQGSVGRVIDDPKGSVFELKVAAPLANGTPVFDSQARLVGIVTTPHSYGEGLVVALGTGRITQARNAIAAATAATSPTPASSSPASPAPTPSSPTAASPVTAPPAESTVALPAPATRRGARGTMVEEGFTSLWKEDSDGSLIEVLDSVKTGLVGDPLAYWTRWTGRDESAPHVVHCTVTFGAQERSVMNFDQIAVDHPADGYWYCAIVGDDLRQLVEEGNYHFTILVDGNKVAENSIRIEKRFFTRGTWAVIAVVIAMLLLAFLRRNKIASFSG